MVPVCWKQKLRNCLVFTSQQMEIPICSRQRNVIYKTNIYPSTLSPETSFGTRGAHSNLVLNILLALFQCLQCFYNKIKRTIHINQIQCFSLHFNTILTKSDSVFERGLNCALPKFTEIWAFCEHLQTSTTLGISSCAKSIIPVYQVFVSNWNFPESCCFSSLAGV